MPFGNVLAKKARERQRQPSLAPSLAGTPYLPVPLRGLRQPVPGAELAVLLLREPQSLLAKERLKLKCV